MATVGEVKEGLMGEATASATAAGEELTQGYDEAKEGVEKHEQYMAAL